MDRGISFGPERGEDNAHLGEVVDQSLEELAGGGVVLGHGSEDLGAMLIDDLLLLTKIAFVVVVNLDPICGKRKCSAGDSAMLLNGAIRPLTVDMHRLVGPVYS